MWKAGRQADRRFWLLMRRRQGRRKVLPDGMRVGLYIVVGLGIVGRGEK